MSFWKKLWKKLQAYVLLNDVTTTPDNPPEYNQAKNLPENKHRRMLFVNANLQKKFYKDLKPLYVNRRPDQAFEMALKSAKKMPRWIIINEDDKGFTIEAVAETRLLRFRDDVIIQIRPEKEGSSIHVRSKSRVGKGDLGTNARRISKYLSKFQG